MGCGAAIASEHYLYITTKARRLMHQAGVAEQRPKRRGPVTTDSRHGYAVAPNLLARQFDVAQPDQVWVGDIS